MPNFACLHVARIESLRSLLPGDHCSWLTTSEQTRLARLRIAPRRDQYLCGHWLARVLLARQLGGTAQDWQLQERPSLPPAVFGQEQDLQLSLTHSGHWIACALSDQPIGIDIEQRRPARQALLHFQHLLLAEDELPNTLSSDELLQRWVVKEAWIKRHHGSALPEHLARLRLRQTDASVGNVRLITLTEIFLGIAASSTATVNAEDGHSMLEETNWLVETT